MFLPEADVEYLNQKGIQFEENVSGGVNGLIIKSLKLPDGKFTHTHSDLLILVPPGYPDIHPDMWYFYPDVLLSPNNKNALATEARLMFNGINWQRWSRHLAPGEWRSSIDGIHTFLKKVMTALENAR